MITISIKGNGHKWDKLNLVTIMKGKRHYDLLRCSKCGIKGRTSSINTIDVKESYSWEKINNCTGLKESDIPKQIKITLCRANGAIFENLKPESIHDVVPAPEGYRNDNKGLWVMGIGEPVKVLTGEFIEVK